MHKELESRSRIEARFPSAKTTTTGCHTQLLFANKGERVWNAINNVRQSLSESAQSIIQQNNLGWKCVYPSTTHNPFVQEKCDIRHIGAVRNRGRWMFWIRITFAPVRSVSTPDGGSLQNLFFLSEIHYRPRLRGEMDLSSRTPQLPFSAVELPLCCNERFNRNMLVKHKKCLVYATQNVRVSNAATLVLPLLLCLLPITLFIDEGRKVGVSYSIFTKVLNVLPLASKGTELIHLARNTPLLTRSNTYGLDLANGFGGASTIVTRCAVDSKLVRIGSSFIAILILATVFGLFLDGRTRRKRVRLEREIRKRPILVRNCIDCYCARILEPSSSSEDESSRSLSVAKNL